MGSVVISVDAELGWGFHDRTTPPTARLRAGREGWTTLLDLFDEYDIPATWAFVGHLLDEACRTGSGTDTCPCTESDVLGDRKQRFAPELVTAVRDADASHELACHSYSHTEFDRISKDRARKEVVRSLAAARDHDIELRSFVFPRSRVDHRDVLAEWGFRSYRGHGPDPGGSRARRFARAVGGWTPPLVTPTVDEYGLVNVPASLYLFRFEGWPRTVVESVHEDPVGRFFRRGLDAAAASEDVLHCWLHPNNIVSSRDVVRLRAVLSMLADRRAAGSVTVETIDEVARRAVPETLRPAAETEAGNT
jgi:peptidoglycan/xylan/chitin deacetylase (PgdA/CDA1 family)